MNGRAALYMRGNITWDYGEAPFGIQCGELRIQDVLGYVTSQYIAESASAAPYLALPVWRRFSSTQIQNHDKRFHCMRNRALTKGGG
jgi:hypothetical protein